MAGSRFIPTQLNDLNVDVSLTSAAQGDVLYRGAAKWNNLAAGTSGYALLTGGPGANPSWSPVATSVGLAAPSEFSVSGSPVTGGSGTLTFTKTNQGANLVYAGPSAGGAAPPGFRNLVAADLPGGSMVNSVSNSDGTLTVSPITGSVVASLALGHANTWTATQTLPLQDKAGQVYNVKAYGATGAGYPTDDGAAIQAAFNACQNANGGVVYFPAAVAYYTASQLTFPAGAAAGNTIRLVGAGADVSYSGTPAGATILDLRYATAGTGGKILAKFSGTLELDGLVLREGGGSNSGVPFLYTTNTTLHVHDCAFYGNPAVSGASCTIDAIVLGGTTTTVDGTVNAPFQGYGTVIRDNTFHRVQRAVYGRTYANSVQVLTNTVAADCGGAAAFDWLGASSAHSSGLQLIGNLVEITNYTYGVRLNYTDQSSVLANNFYDNTGSSADVRVEANANNNVVLAGVTAANPDLSDASGTTLYLVNKSAVPCIFPTGATFKVAPSSNPPGTTGVESWGSQSIPAAATAINCTALGNTVLHVLTSGNNNTGVGSNVLASCTSGNDNVGVGYNVLASLTTGLQCVALGSQAGNSITTGANLTAFGYFSLKNATGSYNTAIGANSGQNVTGGQQNVCLGNGALGSTLQGGNYNVGVGVNCDTAASGTNYGVALGQECVVASNEMRTGPYVDVWTNSKYASDNSRQPRFDLTALVLDNTVGTRKYGAIGNAWDTAQRECYRRWADGTNGRFAYSCPTSAPTTSQMNNSQVSASVNEGTNTLTFTVKYSGGTVKSGTLTLS